MGTLLSVLIVFQLKKKFKTLKSLVQFSIHFLSTLWLLNKTTQMEYGIFFCICQCGIIVFQALCLLLILRRWLVKSLVIHIHHGNFTFFFRLIGCMANKLQGQVQWPLFIPLVFKFYVLILIYFRGTFLQKIFFEYIYLVLVLVTF